MIFRKNISNLIEVVELREDPVIITVNKFDDEAASMFNAQFARAHNTGQKVIPVIISSYGGETMALMKMIDIIKASEILVATIVEGHAMSCGSALFAMGDEGFRFMGPNAVLMIHDTTVGSHGNAGEMKATSEFLKLTSDKVYTLMSRNIGKPDDYFQKIIHDLGHADLYLTAEEAKGHKIANHLRLPSLNIDISVDINLE